MTAECKLKFTKTKIWFIFHLVFCTSATGLIFADSELSEGQFAVQEAEKCKPLPPRPPKEAELELDLLYLLTRGSEFMENYTDTNNAILLLGNTGSGKTTVAQIIAGDLSKLHAVLAPGDRLVIVDEDNRIGLPSTKSKTLIPELVFKEDVGENEAPLPFYDCPGFDDTRGPVQDIAANFFMNQVTEKITHIKMIFLVIHSSVKLGNDRIDFDLLAKHATTFVKNIKKFTSSISLLVNKVDSYNSRGQYIQDHVVIEEIVGFLKMYNSTLYSNLGKGSPEENEIVEKKIVFVETLLEQNSTTGNYNKIWFVRTPLKCGPLSESEMVLQTKSNITVLYDRISYTKVESETDFGFTLKDHSLISISDYTRSINSVITAYVTQIVNSYETNLFKERYRGEIRKLELVSLNDIVSQHTIALNTLFDDITNKIDNTTGFSKSLEVFWNSIGYHLPSKFKSFMYWQDEYLLFFDKATNELQDRLVKDWSERLFEFKTVFHDYAAWYEFCMQLEKNANSYAIQMNKPLLNDSGENWLEYIKSKDITPVSRQIEDVFLKMDKPELNLLEVILKFALDTPNIDCAGGELIITTNFFLIRNVLEEIHKCSTATRINIYLGHTIFMDQDLTLTNRDIVLLAPNWSNTRNIELNILLEGDSGMTNDNGDASNGSDGTDLNNKDGGNGSNGQVGRSGSPGGTVFAIVNNIQTSSKLIITTKGGNGSNGTNGYAGGRGYTRDAKRGSDKADHYKCSTCGMNCGVTRCTSEHYGFQGGNGGNGGHGGKLGLGALAGNVAVIRFHDTNLFNIEKRDGSNGTNGIGGGKGSGAPAGRGWSCKTDNQGSNWRCDDRGRGRGPGQDGQNGETGHQETGWLAPRSPREIGAEWRHILTYRMSFFSQTNSQTKEFLQEIDTNIYTEKYFTLQALAEESLALENVDRTETNLDRLVDMYTILIQKLEIFSGHHYSSSLTEHQKVISILLTTSFSSLSTLRTKRDRTVIVDVTHYFNIISEEIRSLKSITAYQAIVDSKIKFQQQIQSRIEQATNYINELIRPSILQAGEDIEVKLTMIKKQIEELITDARLTLEECKEKFRRAQVQQDMLTAVKVFGTVSGLASSFLPGENWSTFGSVVKTLEGTFSGQPNELAKLEELVKEAGALVAELEERQVKFDEEFVPLVDSLLTYFYNVSDSLNSGDDISAPQLGVARWQLLGKLKECKSSLEDLADAAINANPLVNAFERLQDAMILSIDLYEMIDEYLETKSLAEYISNVNSAELNPVPITDQTLVHTVAKYEQRVQQNILDKEVKKAMHAFKQWVFPFAKFYFSGRNIQHSGQTNRIAEIGDQQLQQVERLRNELEKYKSMIVGEQDTFIIQTNFSSGLKSSKPFFVWENEPHRDSIKALLAGEKVNFNADVLLQDFSDWESIKFKLIEVNFKLNKATDELQEEFDELLNYFGVSMTHTGMSHYRFEHDYFVMTGENQTLRYNFERDGNGNRLGTNQVYEKFKKGDFLLSPFTLWTVQLVNVVPKNYGKNRLRDNVTYDSLKKFLLHIDVELVGTGTYVDGVEALKAAGGDMELDKWYEREEKRRINFNP